ncbi:hypothetical protein [Pseudomonas sp. N040]|uniref:hypothetical protein n=1 Tax=Pseudomonas sp. N040 TaxID=2785325 RepID=UPI0018A32873|nr:hypothetical protein [Pseudomonas sp. N040]MBF7730627.1 hypothetical protein [Pseudomonas sp. N040]MBW7014270.1 hypothetical protein [Pseudomonas sp. N040]
MKALRVVLALSFLLLGGCLVVFREPLPANEPPPLALLGEWSRSNEWGEQMFLDISRSGENSFRARLMAGSPENLEGAEEYDFTVNHSGHRWYLSTRLPRRFGESFAVGGFEITSSNELLVYSLDNQLFIDEIRAGRLQGEVIDTVEGESALVTAPAADVLAFLNDPANADVFVEAARYQRSGQ